MFRHLRQFLKPEGKLLPEKIINIAQLAHADFEHGHQHYPIFLTRHLPELLSLPAIVDTIDLYQTEQLQVQENITLTPLLSGIANAIYLRSYVQIADGCNFTGTDSLMPPTVCQLAEEVALKAGQEVQLDCEFSYGTSLEEGRFLVRG